ncbi:MAG TPA: hypothetical protein VGM13_06490 [Thermoanaerobaculia bacterium]|jgi:2-methylisocitrate lyase-like PEP mutase family enzyme
MSRACTICQHAERTEIDARLAAGQPYRSIAQRCRVSPDAVYRHGKHLGAAIVEAAKTSERVANVARTESIVEKIRALEDEARRLQAVAEAQGDTRAALVALRELRETLAAWSKLVPVEITGANLVASVEWAETRAAILAALVPFPEAAAAVADALRRRRTLGLPGATPRALPPAREDAALEVVGATSAAGKSGGA